jgi:F-box/leucine-rich repeat protein 2/20
MLNLSSMDRQECARFVFGHTLSIVVTHAASLDQYWDCCPRLHTLVAGHCCDTSLDTLLKACLALQSLDMSKSLALTD